MYIYSRDYVHTNQSVPHKSDLIYIMYDTKGNKIELLSDQ